MIDVEKYLDEMEGEAVQRGSCERVINTTLVVLSFSEEKGRFSWRVGARFGSRNKAAVLLNDLNEMRGGNRG